MNNINIQSKGRKRTHLAAGLAASGAVLLAMVTPIVMAEQETPPPIQEAEGLKLPGDLKAKSEAAGTTEPAAATPKFEIEETRTGSRLERVTVKRNNGIDEVYENRNIDSMFSKEANELGEVENVRRWTIGTF